MTFQLDARLAADTHATAELPLSRLLLMDDARFPWLILVPRIVGARELIDLDQADQCALLAEITEVGRAVESLLHPDKLNIATLGNIVSQLHVHLVARYTTDAAWPQLVWGHGERIGYDIAARKARIAELRDALKSSFA